MEQNMKPNTKPNTKPNMRQWTQELLKSPAKKALPILSFPSIQLMNISVKDLISSSDLQAEGMKKTADATPHAAASVSLMDLSVEAECFGSTVRFSDDEVPTVIGSIISSEDDADALEVPPVGACRTGIYIEAIRKAADLIQDRPVLAGVIGPFSLAGRLMDVSEAMIYCFEEPDMVHTVLRKVTSFLIDYCNAYKEAGANGVVIAEPLAGLLSPALAQEFSADYVKEIVAAIQTDEFIVVYHNCGNCTIQQIDSIVSIGAPILHFGNSISMADMMSHIPTDMIAMGNVDPASEFRNGTPESIYESTIQVMKECSSYPNFVISSGCDIPPLSSWDNINAFFRAVEDFYKK